MTRVSGNPQSLTNLQSGLHNAFQNGMLDQGSMKLLMQLLQSRRGGGGQQGPGLGGGNGLGGGQVNPAQVQQLLGIIKQLSGQLQQSLGPMLQGLQGQGAQGAQGAQAA